MATCEQRPATAAAWQGPTAEAASTGTPKTPATARGPHLWGGQTTRTAVRRSVACRLSPVAWAVADLGAGALAFLLALVLRYRVALVVILGLAGAYRRPLSWTGPGEYRAVVQAVTFTLLTLVMATYVVDHANRVSRGWLLATWVLACALVMGTRLLARALAGRLAAAGRLAGRRVLVVGTHPEALAMEWLLRRQPNLGLRVAGFVDDDKPVGAVVQAELPVLGGTGNLRALIQDHGVDVVLISAQASSHA